MNKQANRGIWAYTNLLPPISSQYQLTLGEGDTSIKEIDHIYLKCEFENPTGSVKDRGLAYQVSYLYSKGVKKAVISSSGNAAIAAANYCHLVNIDLTVFVSFKINKSKLDELNRLGVKIIQSSHAVSDSSKFAKGPKLSNLRPSLDPLGHIGYSTIAYEIDSKLGRKVDAIFFPVSSGTTIAGVSYGYQKLGYLPKLFAVQTTAIHPIAEVFDKNFQKTDKSLADALVAKYTPRQKEVIEIIKKSRGWGWVISDKEILEASNWLLNHNIDCSFEGAAALAGLWKAAKSGYKFAKPLILLTGRKYG